MRAQRAKVAAGLLTRGGISCPDPPIIMAKSINKNCTILITTNFRLSKRIKLYFLAKARLADIGKTNSPVV